MAATSESQPSKFRSWLQLMRIANLPTAVSNVMAGAALASFALGDQPSLFKTMLFVVAACVSAFLYTSGMILNDAFDADVDAIERTSRPIPSGRIHRSTAFKVGFALMLIAIATPIGLLVYQVNFGFAHNLRTLLTFCELTVALSVAILLYNGPLKRTWLAAPLMGCCRTLNILLGTCVTGHALTVGWHSSFSNQPWFIYSMSIGLFVTGITLLARSETKHQQSRGWLAISAAIMTLALGLIATVPISDLEQGTFLTTKQAYWAMIALIAFPIVRRLIVAVRAATPQTVGPAIGTSLSSLIFLDAAVCFLVRPDQPFYAGAVALLIIPVMILRRFSAQT